MYSSDNLSSRPLECCERPRPVLQKAGHAYELRQNRKLRQKSSANAPQRHELGNKGWGDIHGRRTGVQQTGRPHHAAASQRGVAVGEVDGRGDRHAALVHHALLGRPEQDQPEHQEPHRLPNTTGAEEEGIRGRGHSRQASARPAGAARHPDAAPHPAAAVSSAIATATSAAAAAATSTSIQDTAHSACAARGAAEADHPAAAADASADHRHDGNDGDRQAVSADAEGSGPGGGTGGCFGCGQHAHHHGKHHHPAAHVHIHCVVVGGGGYDYGGAAAAPGSVHLLVHAARSACGSGGVHSALADGCDCRRCREHHLHSTGNDGHGDGGNGCAGDFWGSRRCCRWNGSASGLEVRPGCVHDPEPHQCARERGGRGGVPSRRGGQAGLC